MRNIQPSTAPTTAPVESDPALRFVLETATVALDPPGFDQAAAALASELAVKLGCSRVTIGLADRLKHRVVASSHTVERAGKQRIHRDIEGLMDEAADQSCPIFHPEPEGMPAYIGHAHRAFAQTAGLACLYTFLLFDHEDRFGAITLEWEQQPERADIRELMHLSTLCGPVLAAKYRADHPWRHWRQRRARKEGRGRGGRWLRTGLFAALAGASLLALAMPATHWVKAEVTIEPEQEHTIVAPMQGFVERSLLRAGDTVRAGEELGRLDRRELELEREKLNSELQQTRREYRGALAGHDRMQTAVFKARADQARAKLALIAEQIKRTGLVSPIDGYVVSGDLSQAIGSPVNRGDVLFEIAPLQAYRVILRVDERDVGFVKEGMQGRLVLNGTPGEELPFQIQRVTPVAESQGGLNVFRVEAKLNNTPAHLRPGMTGVAQVKAGEASIAWIATHRALDWLQLTFWTLEW